ncbi:MAG: DUF2232 domain-containing protein [Acidimicrobiales bacterium]
MTVQSTEPATARPADAPPSGTGRAAPVRHGSLTPIELATAAVMAGVSVALTVIGWFLPHLGPIAAIAVVPLGVVAHRHRFRALAAAAFAAAVLSFLVAGTGTLSNVVECAIVGGLVGTARRRQWGLARVLAGVAVIAPALAVISVGLLAVFSSLRKLTLEQIHNTWKGVARILETFPGASGVTHDIDSFVAAALRDWWITVGVIVVVGTVWFTLLAWLLLGAVLERLRWIEAVDRLDFLPAAGVPGPVPVGLSDVSYRYPGADVDALTGVSMDVGTAEMVALVGDNGSGKSTLARVLAGRPPTSGQVERPGTAGLGRPGGTSMIMQHPETQILGVRVADDVVWGLRDSAGVDVPGLLAAVGLAGMEDRETSHLSGGELQRLAVAAALARRPRLLISDESTAMVDAEGRRRLIALLSGLPASRDVSVVHVTHRLEEADAAERRYRLAGGRIAASPATPTAAPPGSDGGTPGGAAGAAGPRPAPAPWYTWLPQASPSAEGRLVLRSLSHTYGVGSPWAQPALHGVDLVIEGGEGVLIVGGNGSGKSTLAWIMAGVLRPSRGVCLLGDQPVVARVGDVGLAFQHSRLQLQRSRVAADVQAASGADDGGVAVALAAVGLDVAEIGDRRVDELSGGQQRRVALAGILARKPQVLVLDEPLAGLDQPSQEALIDMLSRLRRSQGLTVVVISHDLEGTDRVCDRVVRLSGGRVVGDESRSAAPC